MSDPEPTYTLKMVMHARLTRGGYMFVHEIKRNGIPVATMTSTRETRGAAEVRGFAMGEIEFLTWDNLKAAIEAANAPEPAP